LGLRENCRGNRIKVGLCRLVAIHRVNEAHGLMDRHRRELNAIGHIAERIDVIDIRARILVDKNLTACACRDASSLQAEPFCIGLTPERQHELADIEDFTTGKLNVKRPIFAFVDAMSDRMEDDTDTLLFHRLVEAAPHIHVETAQYLLPAVDQCRLASQAVKDVGEFNGNVTATCDGYRLRQLIQMEGFVRGDGMFEPWESGVRARSAADSDKNSF